MSDLSVNGLRQAFLDPASRVRLSSDPELEEHTELVAIAWQGGFLDGVAIHFNENLNVLIGGRGTGKSTVVESIRYLFNMAPLGVETKRLHDEFVKSVLKSGTRISALIRSYYPTKREYLIERTVPNLPVVRDVDGALKQLAPMDVAVGAEVFGQHEISELTRSPDKLTHLLARFVRHDPDLDKRKRTLLKDLRESRTNTVRCELDLSDIVEQLATLPALKETLKRFQEAGIEDKLKDRSELIREEAVLKTAESQLQPFRDVLSELESHLPVDTKALSKDALKGLTSAETLAGAGKALDAMSGDLTSVAARFGAVVDDAANAISSVRSVWDTRREKVEADYERTLREIQSEVDGDEFVQLKTKIEELKPLEARKGELDKKLTELVAQRQVQLVAWADVHTDDFRELETAAKKVNKQLAGRVKVSVTFAGNHSLLEEHLRGIKGMRSQTLDAIRAKGSISVKELADTCRAGRDAIRDRYGLQPSQAEKLAEATREFLMELEELQLPTTTDIQLNVAAEGEDPVWKSLDDLSTGQKATAVLLLLLLESSGPLVVDQPEDDLDNRFITEGVVPKIRDEKRRRQFIFATHNANIPVLGDAELIVGLATESGHAYIPPEHMGSIDTRQVREIVEETLEGGKDAFEMRRLKYGF